MANSFEEFVVLSLSCGIFFSIKWRAALGLSSQNFWFCECKRFQILEVVNHWFSILFGVREIKVLCFGLKFSTISVFEDKTSTCEFRGHNWTYQLAWLDKSIHKGNHV